MEAGGCPVELDAARAGETAAENPNGLAYNAGAAGELYEGCKAVRETVDHSLSTAAAAGRRAVDIAAGVLHGSGIGSVAVRGVEGIKHRVGAASGHRENDAVAELAAPYGRTVEITVGAGNQTRIGLVAIEGVNVVETDQHGVSARGRDPVNHACIRAASGGGGAIEVAVGAFDQPADREGAGCLSKIVDRGGRGAGDPVERAASVRALKLCDPVERSVPRLQQRSQGDSWNLRDGLEYSNGRHLEGISGVRRAVEITVEANDHRRYRIAAVGSAGKVIEHSQHACRGDFEDGAVAVGASEFGGAVEVAVVAKSQTSDRGGAVRPVEIVDRGESARWRDLEDRTFAGCAPGRGGPVNVAIASLGHHRRRGAASAGSEVMEILVALGAKRLCAEG